MNKCETGQLTEGVGVLYIKYGLNESCGLNECLWPGTASHL